MTTRPFVKMHGLGNDFVVLDARRQSLELSVDQVRAIADRHTGVGCDQLIIVEAAKRGARYTDCRISTAFAFDPKFATLPVTASGHPGTLG